MNTEWSIFLNQNGAHGADGVITDFGDAAAELQAAAQAPVMSAVSQLGMLCFSGEDAAKFLQGQLSCDVLALALYGSVYGACCSPKGRVLANFLLWRASDGYYMAMPRELLPALQKRLGMFVMRSKVKVEDTSDRLVILGLSHQQGDAGLVALAGAAAAVPHQGVAVADGLLLRLSATRWLWLGTAQAAMGVWSLLADRFRPVGASAWSWLDIRAGVPWVTAATQDQFVPQMINLELIGGVSFQKGCYTGQEIVARTQYLGKLKRRMYLAHIPVADPPAPGTAIYSDDLGDQASGMVVNAQASPLGGVDMLAVAQVASVESSRVHVASLDGQVLACLPLPYALP